MPTFRSPRNPNFKLWSSRLPKPIAFADGLYSTDDPDELKILRRHVKAGTLTEGEFSGEFHRGGVIPSSTVVPTAVLDAGTVISPHQAEQIRDDGGAPVETVEETNRPAVAWADVPEGRFAETREALSDLNVPSNRELRKRCAELGIQVPERAGKKALLDAIEIAEQQRQADAEGDDDFDPNDPDGS